MKVRPNLPPIHTQTSRAPTSPTGTTPSSRPGSPTQGGVPSPVAAGQANPAPTPPPSPKTQASWQQFNRLSSCQSRQGNTVLDMLYAPRNPEGKMPATTAEQHIYANTNAMIRKQGYDLNNGEAGALLDRNHHITWHGHQPGKAIDMPDVDAAARVHTHPDSYDKGHIPSGSDLINSSVSYLKNGGSEYFMHRDNMYRIEPDRRQYIELTNLPGKGLTGDVRIAAETPLPPSRPGTPQGTPDGTGI